MTRISVNFLADALVSPVGARGYLLATSSRVRSDGSVVTAPAPVRVSFADGVLESELVLEPSGVSWFWKLAVTYAGTFVHVSRNVVVPDVVSVDWADLVDVDPATMLPDPGAVPAWQAAVAQAAALLADTVSAASEAAQAAATAVPAATEAGEARDLSKTYRDEAETFAVGTVALQDAAIAQAIDTPGSETQTQLNATIASIGGQQTGTIFTPDSARAALPSKPLVTVTPDGSGQVTHTSVAHIPEGFNGYPYWLAATPYPSADVKLENPCIWASRNGTDWVVPAGVTNPIEATPAAATGYNSDTHLYYDKAEKRLYCFWRTFDPASPGSDERIYYRTATEGDLSFSVRTLALANLSTTRRLVSPAIHKIGSTWHMWANDLVPSPMQMVHLTAPSPTGPWAIPEACPISPAWPSGREVWHLDVQPFAGAYYALMMDHNIGTSGGEGDLYFMSSPDGEVWTRGANPVIYRQGGFMRSWYRSGMVPMIRNGESGFDLFLSSIGIGSTGKRRASRSWLSFAPRDSADTASRKARASIKSGYYDGGAYATFKGADGPLLTDDLALAPTVYTGSPQIISNQLGLTSEATTKLVWDVASPDVYAEITVPVVPSPITDEHWLIFRASNTSNYLRVGLKGQVKIEKIIAGASTSLATLPDSSSIAVAPIRIGVEAKGDVIQVYVNGSPYGDPITETAHNTATRAGIQISTTTARISQFRANALI